MVAAWGTFVGRAAELDVLDAACRRARAGDGALVMVGGEPGIGKSHLVDHFAADARRGGASVAWGRCWEAGGAPAFWPWAQVVRGLVRSTDAATVRALAGTGAAELAQIVPEVRAAFDELPEPGASDPDTARFRLFDAVASFLRAAAADHPPLVVAIDDLQAADTPSLLLLQFCARELRDAHVMLVVTYRSTEVTSGQPLADTLAELTRAPSARRLVLEGLAPGELSEYVESVAGEVVDRDLVDALEDRTDGNPLFVSELMRLVLSEAGPTLRLPDEIPEGVKEAITRRTNALSPRCRELLELAAVLGRDVPRDTLQAMAAIDGDELLDALDEAVAAGLLVRVPGAAGDLRFAHVLGRDAIYDQLPTSLRARSHLRAAAVIESVRASDLDPHLSEVAYHYIQAGPVADAATAAQRAAVAGRAAVRRVAYEEATRLLQAAADLTERAPDVDDLRLDVLLDLGDALARAGDLGRAQATFRVASDLARARHAPEAQARAAIGYGGRFAWCRAGDDTELIPILLGALDAIGPADSALRVLLLARLAGARRSELDARPRREEAVEAVAMAKRLADPRALVSALAAYHGAIWEPATPRERLDIGEEMLAGATAIDDAELIIVALCARWVARWELGDFAGAREDVATTTAFATRLKQPAQRWLAAIGLAAVALFEGRFDEVERHAANARREGIAALQFDADSAELIQMTLLRVAQGRASEIIDDLARGAAAYPWYTQLRALLARAYAAVGDLDRARAEMEALAPSDFESALIASNYATLTWTMLADVATELGDASRAAALYERLLPYADQMAMAPPEVSAGSIERALGRLCTVLGRADEAERRLQTALRVHESTGALPWLAATHAHLAALLAASDPDRSAEHGRQAAAIADRLGAPGLESDGPARLASTNEAHDAGEPESCFLREGDYWTIAYAGRAVRLRHAKGLVHLAALLAHPGRDVPAVDLAALADGAAGQSGAGELLDSRAKSEYRQRVADLQSEIDEAENWADGERAERARRELDFLLQELAHASGLGGRDRTFASDAERARQRVKKAIATSLGRLDAEHPALGRHLTATLRTGFVCRYDPDPRVPITWRT